MGKKQVLKTLKGVANLDYPEVHGVPMVVDEEHGEGVHAQVLGEVEQLVSSAIISQRLPIRGAEVEFLRKSLGLSRLEFAKGLSLSDVAVLKWERDSKKRLALVNEVAVRAYFAPKLGVKLAVALKDLVGVDAVPKKLVIQFSNKAKRKIA